jgi:hypothetical protein
MAKVVAKTIASGSDKSKEQEQQWLMLALSGWWSVDSGERCCDLLKSGKSKSNECRGFLD